jgi:hypothetical protein
LFQASIIAALLLGIFTGPAWAASECLKDLTTLDRHYGLGVTQADSAAAPAPRADATTPPPAPGANSQLDTVPNTGGVVDQPTDQLKPLTGTVRDRVAGLLREAKQADTAGDGTVCADRLRLARQLAQQSADAPSSDLH